MAETLTLYSNWIVAFTDWVEGPPPLLPSKVQNRTLVALEEQLPQGDLPNTSPAQYNKA
jgi:hypothetical protein